MARKFNREFGNNPIFNQEIDLIANALIDTLALKANHSPHFFYMHLAYLEETDLLYYKEIHDLLEACVLWLLEKKNFSSKLFEDMTMYFDLLPLYLQFLFSYAKVMYDCHVHSDSNSINSFIETFQNQPLNASMKELYDQLNIYHQLLTHQIKKNGF